jgi:hypothetical protein
MKTFKLKCAHLFFLLAFAAMFYMPNAFANGKPYINIKNVDPVYASIVLENKTSSVSDMYNKLQLNLYGLSENAFQYAMKGYEYLKSKGKIGHNQIITIVDFTKSSAQKRLFVIDLKSYKILFNTYVAHGQGSGGEMATQFSNVPESLQSSLGFYKTSSTYIGKNGFSLKLEGLENGINDKAYERAIVMHGAHYVSAEIASNNGLIGRSWGCPAVPEQLNKPIIEKIKNGSCLFIFSENKNYLHKSRIINS